MIRARERRDEKMDGLRLGVHFLGFFVRTSGLQVHESVHLELERKNWVRGRRSKRMSACERVRESESCMMK